MARPRAVSHDIIGHVLAARPVAAFALDAIFEPESIVSLPVLRVVRGGMATETHPTLGWISVDSGQMSDFTGLGHGQRGKGLRVLREAPDAERVAGSRLVVARPASLLTHVHRVARCLATRW